MNEFSQFFEFFRLQEPNVRIVFAGVVLLASISGLVGTFTFLRKQALIGDVIAHSILPGICLAFLAVQAKNPVILLLGAVFSGWLSTYFVDRITQLTKLKEDTAIALILSVFFGLGILLLTVIQQGGYGGQSGLDQFIFGRAANMTPSDVYLLAVGALLITAAVILLFRGLTVLSFDPEFARSVGFPVKWLQLGLSTATVLTVALGVQAVGVVLMSALLITPAAAARFWTNKLVKMTALTVLFSVCAALLGSATSYSAAGMPTGPWIVMFLTLFALGSAFIGTRNGVLLRIIQKQKNSLKILKENTLKSFYYLNNSFSELKGHPTKSISQNAKLPLLKTWFGLQILRLEGSVKTGSGHWLTTEEGKNEAIHIVRKHRLWELYLSRFMHLKPDHVHEDAEGIEHIITPEIEAELLKELDFPDKDPHNKAIPMPKPNIR